MKREIGSTGVGVAPVALGCWPMAGVTTLGASHAAGVATVQRAIEAGVNHFDTAYVYGPAGESDRILAEALRGRRDSVVIASKVGVHYETAPGAAKAEMVTCGRPEVLRREGDELLRRLETDRVELLYLHSPDPSVALEESAGALRELQIEGKAVGIGVSNTTLDQTKAFAAVCPIAAVQLPYNLLQRDIELETIPWCLSNSVSVMAYWPLMKGLLAGRLDRDRPLDETDSRRNYPMYQGEEWRRNQAFVDELRAVADEAGKTVAQVVVNWTMNRPGITGVLCGAKRPEQIAETAGAMGWELSSEQLGRIERAVADRGEAAAKRAFR